MSNKLFTPAALTLLFGATFSGNATAMEPVIDYSMNLASGSTVALTNNVNQNNVNQKNSQLSEASKPGSLRQLDAELGLA